MSTPDPYTAAVGRRLRAVREAYGLSLQDIERRSYGRFKRVVIGSWERGDRHATAERLDAYARWLEVSLLMLMPGAGDELLAEFLALHPLPRIAGDVLPETMSDDKENPCTRAA